MTTGQKGISKAAALALLLAGCSGSQATVIPRLPSDGDSHTAAPKDPARRSDAKDLWSDHQLIAPPQAIEAGPIALPPHETFTLKNGLTVIAVQSETAPTFQLQLAIRAGTRDEPEDKIGLATFAANMLPRGARGKSHAQITRAIEGAGAELSINATYEVTVVRCHAPSAGERACLDTTAAMVKAPTFPAGAVAEVKADLIQAAIAALRDPTQLASMHFKNLFWGVEDVRGLPMTDRSVQAIDRGDLVAWHKLRYTPKNSIMVVTSTKSPADTRAAVDRAFRSWRGEAPPKTQLAAPPPRDGLRIRLVDVPSMPAAQIRIGGLGVAHKDADFFAATVVNEVLGGDGSRSRLAARTTSALPGRAMANSDFERNLEVGTFMVAGAAAPEDTVALTRLLMTEIRKMATGGPTAQEVAAAVMRLGGRYQTRLDSDQEIANALLAAKLHGLSSDYVATFGVEISRVTEAAAKASAARFLDGDNLDVVIVGDGATIEPLLARENLRYDKVSLSTQADAPSEPVVAVSPKQEAEARAILDKALSAKGGRAKLEAVKSLSWKGDAVLNLPNGKVPAKVEKKFVRPDKLRLDMVIQMNGNSMSITTALTGTSGWAREGRPDGARVIPFPKSEVEAGRAQMWRDQDFVLLRHLESGAKVAPLPDKSIGGVAHHAIRVTAPGGTRSVVLLIDKKTLRLAGLNYSEQGVSAEERFSDYRKTDGIDIAHKRTTNSAQVNLSTVVTEVKINPKVDPKVFVQPADGSGQK